MFLICHPSNVYHVLRSASRTSVLVECDQHASVDEDFADVHKLVFEDDEEKQEGGEEEEEEVVEEGGVGNGEGTSTRADNRVGKYFDLEVPCQLHGPLVHLLHLHVSSVSQLWNEATDPVAVLMPKLYMRLWVLRLRLLQPRAKRCCTVRTRIPPRYVKKYIACLL